MITEEQKRECYSVKIYDNTNYYIETCNNNEYVLIENLFVPAKMRRKGNGRKLLKKAINFATLMDLEIYIEAVPVEENDISIQNLINFYKSEGFCIDSNTERGVLMKLEEKDDN